MHARLYAVRHRSCATHAIDNNPRLLSLSPLCSEDGSPEKPPPLVRPAWPWEEGVQDISSVPLSVRCPGAGCRWAGFDLTCMLVMQRARGSVHKCRVFDDARPRWRQGCWRKLPGGDNAIFRKGVLQVVTLDR